MTLFGGWLGRNTVVAAIWHALGHVHNRAPVPFAEAVSLWSVGQAELLDDRRGLAVVTIVVCEELAIGTQV